MNSSKGSLRLEVHLFHLYPNPPPLLTLPSILVNIKIKAKKIISDAEVIIQNDQLESKLMNMAT